MSADNGIYIVGSPKSELDSTLEYRVAHCQAVENAVEGDYVHTHCEPEVFDAYRVALFGRSQVYATIEDAQNQAYVLYRQIMEGSWPVLEYGVCLLQNWSTPFPKMTAGEADEILRK
jgi:hypothetical protein